VIDDNAMLRSGFNFQLPTFMQPSRQEEFRVHVHVRFVIRSTLILGSVAPDNLPVVEKGEAVQAACCWLSTLWRFRLRLHSLVLELSPGVWSGCFPGLEVCEREPSTNLLR
jgi:hypothetical protein